MVCATHAEISILEFYVCDIAFEPVRRDALALFQELAQGDVKRRAAGKQERAPTVPRP